MKQKREMAMVIQIFRSHEEAEAADRRFYASLTPGERVDMLIEMVNQSGEAAERFERVCRVVPRERR